MTLYAIWREYPPMTPESIDAMHFRAAMSTFMVPVRWVRSFVIDGESSAPRTICIYEGESEEQVVEHARCALMPLSVVRRVREERAAGYELFGPSGTDLVLAISHPGERAVDIPPGWVWRRSFTGDEGMRLDLYSAADMAGAPPAGRMMPVTEGLPEMVSNVYDSLGISRYWEG